MRCVALFELTSRKIVKELALQNRQASMEQKDKLQKAQDEALDWYLAYMFVRNSDKKCYQSKVDFYAARYTDKQDEYPTCIDDAVDALAAHRVDNEGKNKNGKDGKQRGQSKTPKSRNKDFSGSLNGSRQSTDLSRKR